MKTVLHMLHDDYGHQGLDRTLALVRGEILLEYHEP